MATVDIGGVTTHYEEQGEGDPLVLLHGGMSDSSAWGMQLPALSATYHVYAPDRRGHGRTYDNEEPYTYEAAATETIAFLEQVVGGPAHLVGWSDGGNVALLVSVQRPDLVRRQVVIGANFHFEGLVEGFGLGDDPDAPDVAIFRGAHEAASPDGPEHWPVFFHKSARMWREGPTMTAGDVARVEAPTLVLAGDDEMITLEHICAMYEALPAGQLAIVPGTSHVLLLEKADLVNRLLLEFLAETAPPSTLMPIRRA
jgi:pimeloyl-ACP methyl ester carboxylesterase